MDQLLDFHLEHDPDARTVTVTTLVDQNGQQIRHTVTGRYSDGDNGPALTYTHHWKSDGLTLTSDGVKDAYGPVMTPPMRADLTLALQVREAESHAETVHRADPRGMSALAYALRRRTPESRFAYLAEQRQEMVDRGVDADELAVFDALAVAGWMGAA